MGGGIAESFVSQQFGSIQLSVALVLLLQFLIHVLVLRVPPVVKDLLVLILTVTLVWKYHLLPILMVNGEFVLFFVSVAIAV